jgi:hypothetical protein
MKRSGPTYEPEYLYPCADPLLDGQFDAQPPWDTAVLGDEPAASTSMWDTPIFGGEPAAAPPPEPHKSAAEPAHSAALNMTPTELESPGTAPPQPVELVEESLPASSSHASQDCFDNRSTPLSCKCVCVCVYNLVVLQFKVVCTRVGGGLGMMCTRVGGGLQHSGVNSGPFV